MKISLLSIGYSAFLERLVRLDYFIPMYSGTKIPMPRERVAKRII